MGEEPGGGLRLRRLQARVAELLPPEKKAVADSIDSKLKTIIDSVSKLNPDIEVAVSDAEKAKLDTLLTESRDLITTISDQYGAAIGLSAGFSFSDGD